jgi:hypothetical protein
MDGAESLPAAGELVRTAWETKKSKDKDKKKK